MATAEAEAGTASARFCADCGAALQGKFCSVCGSPDRVAPVSVSSGGWGSLTSEFLSSHGHNGIFAVAFSFLRHPVDTIIRLTDDPSYRSQWGFLTATVGAQLTLLYVIMPRILTDFFNIPAATNSSAVLTSEIVQYVGMAILTPIQYYVCRALGTIPRSPMAYVKLCVLSVSYGALLSSLVSLGVFAAAIVIMKTMAGSDTASIIKEVGTAFGLLAMLGVLIFVSASHKRFWGMSWPIAIGVTLAIAAVSWFVVYPGLGALVTKGGVASMLSSLTG
jgi:hypothetical protein